MTKHRVLMAIALGGLLTGVRVFADERFYKSSPTQKSGYSRDVNELRARFNSDKAKVRLLMLLSPT
jgi:hypothetical protein